MVLSIQICICIQNSLILYFSALKMIIIKDFTYFAYDLLRIVKIKNIYIKEIRNSKYSKRGIIVVKLGKHIFIPNIFSDTHIMTKNQRV